MKTVWLPWFCRFTDGSRYLALALLIALTGAASAQADEAAPVATGEVLAAAAEGVCAALPELTPMPVHIQLPDSEGDAVIKRAPDGRIYVRPEDRAVFAFAGPCPANTYVLLPWPAQFDPDTLTLIVTPPAQAYGERTENAAVTSPDVPAALLGMQATASLSAATGVPVQAGLAVQGDVRSGDLGAHVALDAGAQALLDPPDAAADVNAAHITLNSAYVSYRRGELEVQAGLVNAGRPLLGAAISHDAGGTLPPRLRVESALGGPYTLSLGSITLRQGYLQPGITTLDDLILPAGDGALTVTIDEPTGRRTVSLPYHTAVGVPTGTLSYRVAAGLTPPSTTVAVGAAVVPPGELRPEVDARASYQLSPALSVQGHVSAGPEPAVGATLTLEPRSGPGGSVGLEASRNSASGTSTVSGSAGVSAQAGWGTWSGGLGVRRRDDPTAGQTDLGADVFVGATTSRFSVQAGVGSLAGAAHAQLTVSGTFDQGNWTLQGQVGGGRGQLNLGLTLFPQGGRSWQVTAGTQGRQPQLAARYTLDTGAWSDEHQLPPIQASVTARVLPMPGAQLDVTGPVNATVAVTAGTAVYGQGVVGAFALGTLAGSVPAVPPSMTMAVNGQWGVAAGHGTLVTPGLSRLLVVQVGVPAVRVTVAGQTAWSGPDGRAVLSVPRDDTGLALNVHLEEQTVPISAVYSRLDLRVRATPHALALLADFTPYLERSALRRLSGRTFPAGTVARAGGSEAPVSSAGYFALPAKDGDVVEVSWPGGRCQATYTVAEELPCQ